MSPQEFERITAHRHLDALRKIRRVTQDPMFNDDAARTCIREIALAAVAPIDIAEVIKAQEALDFHPDASPFWDSPGGQDVLQVRIQFGLEPMTNNRQRIAAYREAMREDMEEVS